MLKPMIVSVEYRVCVQKTIIADNNDDDDWEEKSDEFAELVNNYVSPALKKLKDECRLNVKSFDYEWEVSVDEM